MRLEAFTSAGWRGAAAEPRSTPRSAAMRRLLLYAATAAAAQTERVLVRFDGYASSAWHRATVSKALGPEGRHWVSADRRRAPPHRLPGAAFDEGRATSTATPQSGPRPEHYETKIQEPYTRSHGAL